MAYLTHNYFFPYKTLMQSGNFEHIYIFLVQGRSAEIISVSRSFLQCFPYRTEGAERQDFFRFWDVFAIDPIERQCLIPHARERA